MELLRNNMFSRGNPVAVVTNANIGNDSQARSVQSATQPDMDINRLFQQASLRMQTTIFHQIPLYLHHQLPLLLLLPIHLTPLVEVED